MYLTHWARGVVWGVVPLTSLFLELLDDELRIRIRLRIVRLGNRDRSRMPCWVARVAVLGSARGGLLPMTFEGVEEERRFEVLEGRALSSIVLTGMSEGGPY